MSVDPGDPPILAALRTALEADHSAFVARPSQLRSRLNRILGEDATTHRRELHLVVTALDENVPTELRAAAPLSRADLDRHSEALAAARGWTDEAGATAVGLWVSALGLELRDADSWPAPAPRRPGPAADGSWRSSPSSSGSLASGASAPDDGFGGFLADSETTGALRPEAASTVLPRRRDDPMATDVPDASSIVASVVPDPQSGGREGAPVPWPSSSRFAVVQAMQREGFPVGAYYAFRGRDPRLRYAALGAFTVVVTGLVFIESAPVRTLLLLVAVLAVLVVPTKIVRNGTMVVDDVGFRWYAALPKSGPAELAAPWTAVHLIEGTQPRLTFPDGQLWLKRRKGLLEALRARVPVATDTAAGMKS